MSIFPSAENDLRIAESELDGAYAEIARLDRALEMAVAAVTREVLTNRDLRAATIEECAKVCDEHRAAWIGYLNSAGSRCSTATLAAYEHSAKTASECAKGIRALSEPQAKEGKNDA